MASWAQMDDDVVIQVIKYDADTVDGAESDEPPAELLATYGGTWRRTWYDSPPHRYAGVGMSWNADLGDFVMPQPFPSWTLGDDGDWHPPIPQPDGDPTMGYVWNETLHTWIPRPG